MIHENIPPFKTFVEEHFFYDMDPVHEKKYVPATIFAISSYPGHAMTVQALLDNGSLFSYLPLHALRQKPEQLGQQLELSDLVYKNCPSREIVVNRYPFLEGTVQAYFVKKELWMSSRYLFTIDWPDDNEQFHFLAIENGQYATLPNHKVKFKESMREFPAYKKLRREWKV